MGLLSFCIPPCTHFFNRRRLPRKKCGDEDIHLGDPIEPAPLVQPLSTEHREDERQLRDSLILSSLPAMVTVVTLGGVILHQNPSSALYYGDHTRQPDFCDTGGLRGSRGSHLLLLAADNCAAGRDLGNASVPAWEGRRQEQDVLTLLFILDPNKRARMIDALERLGEGGVWKAIVRVPYTLLPASDNHGGASSLPTPAGLATVYEGRALRRHAAATAAAATPASTLSSLLITSQVDVRLSSTGAAGDCQPGIGRSDGHPGPLEHRSSRTVNTPGSLAGGTGAPASDSRRPVCAEIQPATTESNAAAPTESQVAAAGSLALNTAGSQLDSAPGNSLTRGVPQLSSKARLRSRVHGGSWSRSSSKAIRQAHSSQHQHQPQSPRTRPQSEWYQSGDLCLPPPPTLPAQTDEGPASASNGRAAPAPLSRFSSGEVGAADVVEGSSQGPGSGQEPSQTHSQQASIPQRIQPRLHQHHQQKHRMLSQHAGIYYHHQQQQQQQQQQLQRAASRTRLGRRSGSPPLQPGPGQAHGTDPHGRAAQSGTSAWLFASGGIQLDAQRILTATDPLGAHGPLATSTFATFAANPLPGYASPRAQLPPQPLSARAPVVPAASSIASPDFLNTFGTSISPLASINVMADLAADSANDSEGLMGTGATCAGGANASTSAVSHRRGASTAGIVATGHSGSPHGSSRRDDDHPPHHNRRPQRRTTSFYYAQGDLSQQRLPPPTGSGGNLQRSKSGSLALNHSRALAFAMSLGTAPFPSQTQQTNPQDRVAQDEPDHRNQQQAEPAPAHAGQVGAAHSSAPDPLGFKGGDLECRVYGMSYGNGVPGSTPYLDTVSAFGMEHPHLNTQSSLSRTFLERRTAQPAAALSYGQSRQQPANLYTTCPESVISALRIPVQTPDMPYPGLTMVLAAEDAVAMVSDGDRTSVAVPAASRSSADVSVRGRRDLMSPPYMMSQAGIAAGAAGPPARRGGGAGGSGGLVLETGAASPVNGPARYAPARVVTPGGVHSSSGTADVEVYNRTALTGLDYVPHPINAESGASDGVRAEILAAAAAAAGPPALAAASGAAARGRGIRRAELPPPELLEAHECWHEVWATFARDPATGQKVLIITQMDVTAKVIAERHLALVMETEHRLVEQLFPRHILQYIMEQWTATERAVTAGSLGPTSGRAAGIGGGGRSGDARQGEAEVERHGPDNAAGGGEPTSLHATAMRWRPVIRDCNALATCHPEVTLLFADIKGFTPMCKEIQPQETMTLLNALYSRYDALLDTYGVFKVETIGDCYFVAGGLMHQDEIGMAAVRRQGSQVDPDHAIHVFGFAKAMLLAAREVLMPTTGQPVEIRIGIHTGPVVSGVVGTHMPRFCLFGDTVNTASRMESTGVPGAIHVSEATFRHLPPGDPQWAPTGGIEVKGKGHMKTYLWRPQPPA